ncbi:MAG: T9SS type A sorting domain-containing protein [Flavobacteriales bacterium]|nr:T9SS type A sorting domain-containing protein [Flavobacteriales bacterium]
MDQTLKGSLGLSLLLAAVSISGMCVGQSFVNPGFESGSTGWSGCPLEINSASVYGGTGSNQVAEVDGHINAASTADDRMLCQTLTGFTVGAIYLLEFDATRRQSGGTPASVSVTVQVDDVLYTEVTRTGGWNMVREQLTFTAQSTSHTLSITPNFTVSLGMLFDDFDISVASPLPVQMLHFDARTEDDHVRLDWATGSEQNNAGFSVERSTDLDQWEQIAFVQGAGNSQHTINYQAVDDRPIQGSSYYRLQQIDEDGSTEITAVQAIHLGLYGTALSIWPNPTTSLLHVRTNDPGSVQVLNALGQRMTAKQRQEQGGVELRVAHLPPGQYVVRSSAAAERSVHFIKE